MYPNTGTSRLTLLELAARSGLTLFDPGPDFRSSAESNFESPVDDIDWDDILDSDWARERIGQSPGAR